VPYFLIVGADGEYGIGTYYTGTGKIGRDCVIESSVTGGIAMSTGATGLLADSPLPHRVGWYGGGSFYQSDSFTASGGGNIPWGADTTFFSKNIGFATGQCTLPCWCSKVRYNVYCKWSSTAGGDVTLTATSPRTTATVPVSQGHATLEDNYIVWHGDGMGEDYTTWSCSLSHTSTGTNLAVESYLTIEFS
jgi:hypothetical protein